MFRDTDPWNYSSDYEQEKYRHTLEILPDVPIGCAVELGCAEGVFTQMLAARVGTLLAVDISDRALDRARTLCGCLNNVQFKQHNISHGMVDGQFDLVVCSEILYYLRDHEALVTFGASLRNSVRLGGHMLLTHANVVSDDRNETGFDFHEIGAKHIGATFASLEGLDFIRELRTELYRVQLFRVTSHQPTEPNTRSERSSAPREVLARKNADFDGAPIKWGGCAVTGAEARHLWLSRSVPILMYHRVAESGPPALAPYRVSPDQFERHLAWLQREGWHSLDLEQFAKAKFEENVSEFKGKPIVLTFDDGYADFHSNAFPLLKKYCFNATVFIPVGFVGSVAEWDAPFGPAAPLLSWEQINELSDAGVQFGSHGCRHLRDGAITDAEAFREAFDSKKILERHLCRSISGFCYPYGFAAESKQRQVALAGYRYAVCGWGANSLTAHAHYIPRIEVFGNDSMDDFIAKLPAPVPSNERHRQEYWNLRAKRDRATYMGR